MTTTNWAALSGRLVAALHLSSSPVAIAFSGEPPQGVDRFEAPMSSPAPDGRRGRVPASCAFWMHGAERSFTTVAEDHGNCSVGRVTHGLASLDEVAGNDDVAELFGSGWVGEEDVSKLPLVSGKPEAITYSPLSEIPWTVEPDVVLIRVNARQMMVLSDAIPALSIGGKPQCHIVAIAKEQKTPAASVGCALSRARTGMTPGEMTCALPANDLSSIVEAVERAATIDQGVARYAATDAARFS